MAIRGAGKTIVISKRGRVTSVTPTKKRARGQGTASINIVDSRTGQTIQKDRVNLDTGVSISRGSSKKTKVVPVIDESKRLQARIVEVKTGKVVQEGQFKVDPRTERALRQRAILERQAAEQRRRETLATGQKTLFTSRNKQIRASLNKIDALPGLSVFEKENRKRAILNIVPEKKVGVRFTKKELLARQNLEFKPVNVTPSNFYSKSVQYFNNNFKTNYRNNNDARAILWGLGTVAIALPGSGIRVLKETLAPILSPIQTFKNLKSMTAKDFGNALIQAGGRTGARVYANDPTVYSDAIAEIAALKGVTGISKATQAVSKLSPKFIKISNGQFVIKKKPFSSVREFINNKAPGFIKNSLKDFTKNPKIVLKSQTVSSGASTLAKQANIAGTRVTAVNAAADQLTSWLKRKTIIRKPIPGEDKFPTKIKNSLSKFDSGIKLNKKEFASVNLWLQKNVAPNITLLERSLYADPAAGLRVSRLGITKTRTATFRDVLKGNFKLFDRKKPQVLIFENAKVARFPKILKDIEKKLKAGKKLTTAETNKLISWQVETGSGKFKPVGSTIYQGGKELEVTLAPGEFIKRIKRVGFTFVEGKKVNFVTAEVFKPTKIIKDKIKKAQTGKLNVTEVKVLEKELSKNLGRKIKVETPTTKASKVRRVRDDVPVLRVKGRGLSVSRRLRVRKPTARKPTVRARTVRKPTTRVPTARKPTVRKPPVRAPTVRKPTVRKPTTRKPTVRKPTTRAPTVRKPTVRKPAARAPPIRALPLIRLPKGLPTTKATRQGYLIKIKKGNKVLFFTDKPLPKTRAKNLARQLSDNTIGASHSITQKGKTNIADVKKLILGKKFRPKKSKSKKVQIEVEKKKYRLDKQKEKKQIRASPSTKVKRVVKVSKKRKKSPTIKPKRTRTTKTKSKKK